MDKKLCFCFCLPLTFGDFQAELDKPKDFVLSKLISSGRKNIREFWKMYEKQVVKPFNLLQRSYEKNVSFEFFCDVTEAFYLSKVRGGQYDAVIQFSHCKDGGEPTEMIEFFDRLVPSVLLAQAIPVSAMTALDFSVCNPRVLQRSLEALPGKQFVVVNWENLINLRDWLQLYELVFHELSINRSLSYIRAFTNTLKSFYK